ncbi:hypothetical protein [Actinophytocola xanthii]|uniref:Uncharacterized protein n=1 Tax=Actinophytocola xanthii TaxID=1912961 RepID=A0A1Q8CSY0_9PSEU|nr:hypothetical protein [Actinophytocola xanthii]OLF17468.1 hypothetical protein BU204_11010 [Actinophytocola xanthii]
MNRSPQITPALPLFPRTLADALLAEDHAEDTGWLEPLDRMTCRVHRRWARDCPARHRRAS